MDLAVRVNIIDRRTQIFIVYLCNKYLCIIQLIYNFKKSYKCFSPTSSLISAKVFPE